ncbi:hypothetical protein AJ79_07691 [Helicocarpus griseus UAMH5409]|uniref:Uncharacterized protein n=1 Tax=Helicocarpus griseus UAMH5409 TaxID=1447875 RepID=A0A2B7X0I8_9EURO|nr:hypothetical protein AJ79_07691 [Helicocarpus griseus UAMH5409]
MKGFGLPTLILSLTYASGIIDALAVRTLQERSLSDPLAHGNYGHVEGEVYRYQEVADGLFVGVKPEEWDDSRKNISLPEFIESRHHTITSSPYPLANGQETVHARSIDPENKAIEFSPRHVDPGNSLTLGRRDLRDTCRAAARCLSRQVAGAWAGACTGFNWFIDDVARRRGGQVLDILNQPVFANFYGVGGQNALITAVVRHYDKKEAPEAKCSNSQSQVELAKALIDQACKSGGENRAFRINVTYEDGKGFDLSMSFDPKDGSDTKQTCGAPGSG